MNKSYNGRSTGAGSLAVWTHFLRSTEVIIWKDAYYAGKALKMGAGGQGYEAMAAAKAEGLVVLGGMSYCEFYFFKISIWR